MPAFYRFVAIVAIALLAVTQGTFARTPLSKLTVEPPPIPAGAAASAIFDAMVAISRAKATWPAGAEHAAISYAAAMERYRAGDLTMALQNAFTAIALTSRAPYAEPQAWTSPSPTVASTVPMPELVETGQSDAEAILGVARRSLQQCSVTDSTLLQALQQRYTAAIGENLMHRYADVIADSRTVIDACVIRTLQTGTIVPTLAPAPASR